MTFEVAQLFDLLTADRTLIQVGVGVASLLVDVAPLHVVLAEMGSRLTLAVDEEANGVFLAWVMFLLLKEGLF